MKTIDNASEIPKKDKRTIYLDTYSSEFCRLGGEFSPSLSLTDWS